MSGNTGLVRLDLRDASGTPITDPNVTVRFHRMPDRRIVSAAGGLSFPLPPEQLFAVPAFPQVKGLFAYVSASLFRARYTPFFLPRTATPSEVSATLLRRPDAWTAHFTAWRELDQVFSLFRTLLEQSPGLRVRGGPSFERFTERSYDTVSTATAIHAKASLLNLTWKLTELGPREGTSWFSYLERILVIGRERLIALVTPAMAREIRRIKDAITAHPYKHTPAQHHHENYPARFRVRKTQMMSIKSEEALGNVQLTVGPGIDPETGSDILLLDADIDEHGELFAHLADLIAHMVTGGTHPFDVYEFLLLSNPNANLGYVLVPA